MANHTYRQVRNRINELRATQLGKSKLISRVAHEFSVDPSLVNSSMAYQGVVRAVFHNQGSAIGLREETESEELYLDNLRR